MVNLAAVPLHDAEGLSPFETELINLISQTCQILGLPKSVGQIYGFLFAQTAPVTMEEIIRRLGISLGSTSQGLRLLREEGAVRITFVPGDRRDHFEAEVELRILISGFLQQKLTPHLQSESRRLEALETTIQREPAEKRDVLLSKIKRLRSWHRKANRLLPVITAFLTRGTR